MLMLIILIIFKFSQDSDAQSEMFSQEVFVAQSCLNILDKKEHTAKCDDVHSLPWTLLA